MGYRPQDVLCLLVIAAIAALATGLTVNIYVDNKWQEETIKHGVAEFNAESGAWQWRKTREADDPTFKSVIPLAEINPAKPAEAKKNK